MDIPTLNISEEHKEEIRKLVDTPQWHNNVKPLLERYVSSLINTTHVSKEDKTVEDWGKELWMRDESAKMLQKILIEMGLMAKQPKKSSPKNQFH